MVAANDENGAPFMDVVYSINNGVEERYKAVSLPQNALLKQLTEIARHFKISAKTFCTTGKRPDERFITRKLKEVLSRFESPTLGL